MKAVFNSHPDAVQEAGMRLIALGTELLAGRLDDAIARAQADGQKYPEWAALDKAAITLNAAAREQAQGDNIRRELMKLVWAHVVSPVRRPAK